MSVLAGLLLYLALMIAVGSDLVVRWANAAMAERLREAADENPIGTGLQAVWDAIGAHLPEPGSTDCPAARAFQVGTAIHAESAAPVDGHVRNLYLTFLPIRTPRCCCPTRLGRPSAPLRRGWS